MKAPCEESAAAMADACRILSGCVHLPTPDLVESLGDGSLATSVRALLPWIACDDVAREHVEARLAACEAHAPETTLPMLRKDYTRLFAHPTAPLAPILESQFESERRGEEKPLLVVNRLALALDDEYRAAGYARSNGGVVPPDHLGTELVFLALLLDARSSRAASFVERHLGIWAPRVFSIVEQRAETPLYALVGSLGLACFPA